MPSIMPYSQQEYLYFEGWLPEDDNKLLEFMFDKKVKAVAAGLVEEFGEDFIVEAQEELEDEFRSWKDLANVDARVKFLRKRYNTLTFVINHAGATWEAADGYVRASDKTWKAIIRQLLVVWSWNRLDSSWFCGSELRRMDLNVVMLGSN
ncbi:hypothetical protein SASPL_120634 [Salvia splendens]|uniref:Myb/SANT-like domain-containing protein n=1 Tax=Salvia splendens TaxID=180675 RepID=A0A8X8XUM7_SALSN|nr:hypothetical protein SASPL_120634 [Salvia splendens]